WSPKSPFRDPHGKDHAHEETKNSGLKTNGGSPREEKPHGRAPPTPQRLHGPDVTPSFESEPRHSRQNSQRTERQNQQHRAEEQPANAFEEPPFGLRELTQGPHLQTRQGN